MSAVFASWPGKRSPPCLSLPVSLAASVLRTDSTATLMSSARRRADALHIFTAAFGSWVCGRALRNPSLNHKWTRPDHECCRSSIRALLGDRAGNPQARISTYPKGHGGGDPPRDARHLASRPDVTTFAAERSTTGSA